MIHAHIDAVSTKNVIGFECGTRADFDKRHLGDPLWIFFDRDIIQQRLRVNNFFDNPTSFYIDRNNILQQRVIRIPRVKPTVVYLTDSDHTKLVDTDKALLTEPVNPPLPVD